MDDERAQLDLLRKQKRLKDLEAKAGPNDGSSNRSPDSAAQPSIGERLMPTPALKSFAGKVDEQLSPQGVNQVAAQSVIGPEAGAMMKGAGFLKRAGLAATQGLATGATAPTQDPSASTVPLASSERMTNGAVGAGIGTLIHGGIEGVKGLLGVGSQVARKAARMSPSQASAYREDPSGVAKMAGMLDDPPQLPALQDQARGVIENSRKALKATGLSKARQLSELLQGKQAEVDPQALLGHDDEIDSILRSKMPSERSMPQSVSLDANEANKVKRILQQKAAYKPGTPTDPVQDAKRAQYSGLASNVRGGVEKAGGPEVAGLNKDMQEGITVQSALRAGQKNNPLAFVSTESPDRLATIARAENSGGTGLTKFGAKYGAAKSMATKDVDDSLSRMLEKAAGRAGIRAGGAATDAISSTQSPALQGILNELFNKNKQQK